MERTEDGDNVVEVVVEATPAADMPYPIGRASETSMEDAMRLDNSRVWPLRNDSRASSANTPRVVAKRHGFVAWLSKLFAQDCREHVERHQQYDCHGLDAIGEVLLDFANEQAANDKPTVVVSIIVVFVNYLYLSLCIIIYCIISSSRAWTV